jgi:tetratricopeptide (TPR) repeat protein
MALTALFWLLAPVAAQADLIHLKDGRTLRAENCRESGEEILCKRAGGTIGISREQVDRIEKTAGPPSSRIGRTRPRHGEGAGSDPQSPDAPGDRDVILISAGTAAVLPGGPEAWRTRIAELERATGRPGVDDASVRGEAALLYTYLGNEAANQGDFDAAEAQYMRATDHDPGLSPPRLNLARIRIKQGRHDEAEGFIRDVLAGSPDDPSALALLGDVAYRGGRLDEAIEHWERSLEMKPDAGLASRLEKTRKEKDVEEGFFRADAAHFTLKYDGDRASDHLSQEILDHLESTHDDLTSRFNTYPTSVVIVTLYSREAFYDVTESPRWVGGLFDGQIRVPIGGLTRLTRVARDVFTHELTHCIVHHKTRGNSPRWLHEGIAQWVEGKSARRHRRILAEQFSEATPGDVAEAFTYPLALSLLERFLETWTFSHLLDLLDALGGGSDFDAAFSDTTGQSFEQFLESWLWEISARGGSR